MTDEQIESAARRQYASVPDIVDTISDPSVAADFRKRWENEQRIERAKRWAVMQVPPVVVKPGYVGNHKVFRLLIPTWLGGSIIRDSENELWDSLAEALAPIIASVEPLIRPEEPDATRVLSWIKERPRRRPDEAFTAGPDRQAAYWVEMGESQVIAMVAERDRESEQPSICDVCGAESRRCECSPAMKELRANVERLTAENARLREALLETIAGRCYACRWPFRKEHGCKPGNCCFRPGERSSEHAAWLERQRWICDLQSAQPQKGG